MRTVKMAKKYQVKITMQDNEVYDMHTGDIESIDNYSDIWKNHLENEKFANINAGNGTLIVNSQLVKSIEIKPI